MQPGRTVHNHRETCIGQTEFARQHRLRHPGHAHQITPVAPHPGDFRGGFQARPLGAAIDSARLHADIRTFGRSLQQRTQAAIVGIGKLLMVQRQRCAIEKTAVAPAGVVDELQRQPEGARRGTRLDSAHRGETDHIGGAEIGQRLQVGAVVDAMRRQCMGFAVPREVQGG